MYEYKDGENPEERLRNKLSVVFLAIEVAENGNCDDEMIKRANAVIPEIKEHLDDIDPFYKKYGIE